MVSRDDTKVRHMQSCMHKFIGSLYFSSFILKYTSPTLYRIVRRATWNSQLLHLTTQHTLNDITIYFRTFMVSLQANLKLLQNHNVVQTCCTNICILIDVDDHEKSPRRDSKMFHFGTFLLSLSQNGIAVVVTHKDRIWSSKQAFSTSLYNKNVL